MVQDTFQFGTVGDDLADGRLPLAMRALVVLVLTGPAVGKFVLYGDRVGRFVAYGIPAPEVTVLLVGAAQLFTVATVAAGVWGRLGALVTVPIMATAMVVDAPNAGNVLVLVSCLGILLLGTGEQYVWDPFDSGA
jgi:hypothetical protein